LDFAVLARRNDGLCAALFEPFAQGLAVMALVGDEFGGRRRSLNAALCDLAIMHVSRRANSSAEKPDTFSQIARPHEKTTCRRGGPYVSTAGAAMNLDAGTVDEQLVGRILGSCQRAEDGFPYASLAQRTKRL
jgi:hypothetical protein